MNVTGDGPKAWVSDVIVNHAALLAALHSHPDAVSIDTVAPPPPAAMLAAVGVTAYTHPGVVGN